MRAMHKTFYEDSIESTSPSQSPVFIFSDILILFYFPHHFSRLRAEMGSTHSERLRTFYDSTFIYLTSNHLIEIIGVRKSILKNFWAPETTNFEQD